MALCALPDKMTVPVRARGRVAAAAQARDVQQNRLADERKQQQLLHVLQKYGSAGAARPANRLEYHETATSQSQELPLHMVEGPDMLRLG